MAEFTTGLYHQRYHPFSSLESLAKANRWSFNRLDEDLMLMHIESSCRILSITLSVSHIEMTIRLTCSFDLNPREGRELDLYQLINRINQRCTEGAFTIDHDERVVVFRNSIMLMESNDLDWKHLNIILNEAIQNCEMYYPSFQLVNFGKAEPNEALDIVISDIKGSA
ncbi:MAG: YbjN domain-containing protein [Rhodobacteraceae bacterium]|nr:YbjN domain-containing protein [Paracoccaceae bacterium]MCY4249996.1 YbjN domain-containing protein [Paracoccaceae bacterium]